MLSLSDQWSWIEIAAGARNWRCVAALILEALAPVLSKDHNPPPTKGTAMKATSITWRRTFPDSEPGTDGVAIFDGRVIGRVRP